MMDRLALIRALATKRRPANSPAKLQANRRYHAKLREGGRCLRCGGDPGDRAYCKPCAKKRASYHTLKYRAKLHETGRCVDCRATHETKHRRCPECSRKHIAYGRELRAKRNAAGLCTNCPRPKLPTATRCQECNELNRERAKKYPK